MDAYLNELVRYLVAQSWQIAVLTMVVAVAACVLWRRSAHVRYLLWLIVLAKCLVPPLYMVPVRVLPETVPERIPPILSGAVWADEHFTFPSPAADTLHHEPRGREPRESVLVPPVPETSEPRLSVWGWLGVLWIAGAGGYLMMNLLRALRGSRWLRRTRRLPADEVQADLADLLSAYGIQRLPRIWIVEGVGQPFVWGLLRGSIYVPPGFFAIESPQHRRDVLAHELSHVLRFDPAVNTLQIIVQGLFWFHPLVWWANRRIRQEREKCCDEMAVARLGAKPKDYSTALVATLIQAQESTRPVPSLAVAGPVKNIEERIRAMLRPGKKFYRRPSSPIAVIVVLSALLSVPTTIVLTVRAATGPTTQANDGCPIFDSATNLGPVVNGPAHEYDPSISADELELYFNSARPGGLGQTDLWVATRKTKTDPWSEPVNLGPTVNSPAGDKAPCISADGLSLYFSSDRPGGSGGLDLWVTTRTTKDAAWGAPVNLGPTVNSAANEHSPSISTDGLTLYFAELPRTRDFGVERPGGLGKGDIWVTTRKTQQDPWGTPVNLGPNVNSSAWDQAPSISTDGLTLYFDSERGGGSDIWVTTREKTSDPWGTPIKLGPVVNAAWEANPDISRDGSTLYFASNRPGGVGGVDIWQATLETAESRAQSKLVASLIDAVKAGDIEQVRLLLAEGAGVNAKDEHASTPLHEAAGHGWRDVAQLLLDKGANVEAADASGQTPLHRAARFGSRHICALLLDKGASVKARNNRGNTVLHAALNRQEVDRSLFELLLAKGADVKARNEQGETPLHLASRARRAASYTQQREEAADILLAHGAEIDATDKSGRTPLHVAAENGQDKVVGLLLAKGAGVEAKNPAGLTALHIAATYRRHSSDIVELLLNRGADVNSVDSNGLTPLHLAARRGDNETVERLIAKGADVNAKAAHGQTPAHLAANGHCRDTVTLLLSKGADISSIQLAAYLGDLARVKAFLANGVGVNTQDAHSGTPLHAAALGGHKEVAEFLLSKGALVNAHSAAYPIGVTPLHCAAAARAGSKEVAELLIEEGAEIDAKTEAGLTPLDFVSRDNTDTARLLIAHGADVNTKARNGYTPLHYAALRDAKDWVLLLLDHGADMNAQITDGAMPSEVAARQGHEDVVRLLIDKGADLSNRDVLLFRACWNQQKELAEFLIRKGADVNSKRYGDDNAPALDAIWGAYAPSTTTRVAPAIPKLIGILKLLLDNGANPNAKDNGDWYLLHYAAQDAEVTRVLLDKGANPNVIDRGGTSPLHVSAQKGCKPAVELLVARGADPNVKDYDGRTPLALARENGHNETVEFLQQHGAKE
jgi:ankyrin repeat protein/beta-lactamase regulating signal transducer with metallopeptidase domain/Tol biopolymer transport system component